MSEPEKPSAEMRNAFVDGQLGAREWERIAARLGADAPLRQDLGTLSTLKVLVRNAYDELPAPELQTRRRTGAPRAWLVAASAALAVVGWFGHAWWTRAPEPVPAAVYARQLPPAVLQRGHVLVQISTGEHRSIGRMLADVDDLLRAAGSEGRSVEVEVVANGDALQPLLARVSPFAARIAAMRAEHAGLRFIACGQSLQRLAELAGPVELLPGTLVAPSALDQVVKRVQDGWVYLRA